VVQHEDRADPFEEAAEQGVQPGEIEGVKTGADDRRFHRDIFEIGCGGTLIMAAYAMNLPLRGKSASG
jgi:hypothetical protein